MHTTVVSPGIVEFPEIAPYAWSSTFVQARAEAEEEQFSWMTEADQYMFQLELEPVPWEHLEEAASQKGETQFQAMKQRAREEQVM
jgi:hypothetical protein